MELSYLCPPKLPNMANNAKKRATGKIPITVNAIDFAFSHSAFPFPVGQTIASLTLLKMSMPISKATAAPMKLSMKPSDSTMLADF